MRSTMRSFGRPEARRVLVLLRRRVAQNAPPRPRPLTAARRCDTAHHASIALLAHRPPALPAGCPRGGRARPRPGPPESPAGRQPPGRAARRGEGQRHPHARRAERPGRRACGPRAAPRDLPAPRSSGRRSSSPRRRWRSRRRPSAARWVPSGPRPCWAPSAGEFPDVEAAAGPRAARGAAPRPASPTRTRPPGRCGSLVDDAPLPAPDRDAAMAALEAYQATLAADRAQRRDARGAAARPGTRAPDVARRPAALRPRATGAPSWATPSTALLDRMLLAHGRHRRGGARAPPPVRRGRLRSRRRLRAGPRRGPGPHGPGRGAGAVLQRLRLDAAARPGRQEHARLARPAVAALRARDPDASTRSRTRSWTGSPAWGITGLWLIGLWERSKASQRIKVWRGNPDAAASAYSLDDYVIAWDLGGEDAWADLRHRAWQRGDPAGVGHGAQPHGHRLALGHRPPGVVPVPAGAALPGLHVQRREPGRARPGRDPPRGPLLGQQRRRRRVRAARPLVGRAALHLPRQRRHELPLERHRAAGLQPGRRPGAGDPDDPRRRAAVPGHPVRRRDGARQAPRPSAVVPGPRARAARRSRRAPSSGR